MKDRREYMRQYRAAQKAKLAASNVIPLHEPMHEQFVLHEPVPELHEPVTNMLRTDEQPVPQAVRTHVTNTAVTARTPVRNSSNTYTNSSNMHELPPESVFKYPLSRYLSTAVLSIFVILNTAFLIKEQVSFYELKGEGMGYSVFVACITEIAALMLSFFGTWYRKPMVFGLLLPTLGLIFFVIFLGLQRKEAVSQQNNRAVKLLEDEIAVLKEQKGDLERRISLATKDSTRFDQPLYAVKSKLEAKTEELRKLRVEYTDGMEIWVLAALRVLAILWNIAFASLIAFVWKRKGKTIQLFPKEE